MHIQGMYALLPTNNLYILIGETSGCVLHGITVHHVSLSGKKILFGKPHSAEWVV